MGKALKNLLFFLLLPALFAGCSASASNGATVAIIHMNDLGGRVMPNSRDMGGLARMARVLKDLRRRNPDALFLVSGDLITGSPLSTLTRGEGIFRLANMLDISAFAPGNHEFDYGAAQYSRFLSIADFPVIAANLRKSGGTKKLFADRPYVMLEAGGVKVGVIGLITPATPRLTFPRNTEGVLFDDPARTMERLVPEVDREAQLVVALTHLGLEDDKRLARKVPGIDMIVGGHSHNVLYKPIRVKNTRIVQAGSDGNYIGVVKVKINPANERVASVKGRLIEMNKGAGRDKTMAAAVEAEEAKLPVNPDEALGRAKRFMDSHDDVAPWVAWLMKKALGADVGLVNRSGIREDIYKGKVTYRVLFRVMPFDNLVVRVDMKGFELARLLRGGGYIPDRPVKIKYKRTYSVATMDFVAAMRRFPPERVHSTGLLVRDLMLEYFDEKKTLPY